SDLTVEHARHLTTSGTAITCATCHASGDATVVSAIATGNSACSACHGATSGHESLHVTTVTPACAGAGCHVGTSLTSIHINSGTTLTCDSCHKSTDPAVVAAIAGHDLSCTGCHGSAGHTAVHDTTVSASCAGPACHAGSNLIAIHINSGTTLSCASCHTSSDSKVVAAISGGVTDCSACHDVANAHGDLNAVHTAQVSPGTIVFFDSSSSHAIQRSGEVDLSADCTMCHATTNLLSLHANDCSICHSGSAPPAASFPSWNKTCSQGSCHPTYHDNASSAHDDEASDSCSCHDTGADISTANPAFCGECHALGADTTPPTTTSDALASYVGPVSVTLTATDDRELKATYYRLDGGATSTVSGGTVYVASPASGSQSHTLEYWSVDWSGNMEVPHTALFSVSADTQAPVTSSDAKATYAGPVTINLTATDNATSLGVRATYFRFDTGANQTGTTATLPQPGSGAETHTIHFWSVDYAGNIEAEKSATFTVNADLVAPTTTSNLLPAPKYYPGAGSPGKIVISLYPTDPSPSSGIAGIYVDSTNPNTWWGDNHQAGWNAAAGAYQLGMWVFASGDYPVTWYATDNAGNVESPKTTIIKVDADRPVTTSNAISQHTYVGDQTFTLSATDTGGSGLANTYWRLDGGPLTTGTVIPVPAPASGTVSHTINYYSTDNAGNQELGLAYTMFYVQAGPDTIPPTGAVTINAGAAWTNTTAASIVASATDNIGVSQMRFSNDTVTWSAWETYSVIAKSWTLASGNGTKTVYAQYKDAAGNVSATATDTIGLDGTAPVTSSDATPGQTYIGAKTFTLTPADTGGSGVASTFWQLDSTSGAWTAGTSVPVAAPSSGTVSHTLYWYSTDAAGNRESNKSVTFNVSAPPPDTIAPTGSLRINSGAAWTATTTVSIVASATDNVAVAQMRFSNDTVTWSAWETYSTAAKSWILASGNGTKSVYAQYKDAAGNVSATATSTIGLDTIAPVTTAVINAPANGAGTVTLNVSESGSGVQSTKYILTTGGVAGAQQSYAGAIPLAAPVSGSTVYSVEYWSVDNATNTESPHKFTGTIMINAPAAISTLSATLTSGSLHAFKHFVFYDEHGTSIGDSGWMTDDHTGSYSLQVPSGHAYTMFVEWWIPAYDNNGTDSDTFSDSRAVTAAEAQPGATVSWTVNY
ncbi:MAG: hypothetical protein P4L93_09860, partial [Coriobacteriia bacterium]|nr:hypothetical protein [Coriobacteriia bacterium]